MKSASRTIRRSDLVAAENAFIDCRTPGSERKLNYAIIGLGRVGDRAVHHTSRSRTAFSSVVRRCHPESNNSFATMHYTAEVFNRLSAGAVRVPLGVVRATDRGE
jgi:hypothetical protein